MKIIKIILLIAAMALSGACAFMMNLDGAYHSKDVQKDIKEMGALVDPLKFQNPEKYSYRILADNAALILQYSRGMKKHAPDSYYLRQLDTLGVWAENLQWAASRAKAEETGRAIAEILAVWNVLDQYRKPA